MFAMFFISQEILTKTLLSNFRHKMDCWSLQHETSLVNIRYAVLFSSRNQFTKAEHNLLLFHRWRTKAAAGCQLATTLGLQHFRPLNCA
jgi:hypothetical protein